MKKVLALIVLCIMLCPNFIHAGLIIRGDFRADPINNIIYCIGPTSICGELFPGADDYCTFIDVNNHAWRVCCSSEEAEDAFEGDLAVPVQNVEEEIE